MDLIEAIKNRKSIRDFKTDQVSQKTIREILEIVCRAPSSMNSQPWEFIIVAKDTLDSIRNTVIKKLKSGEKPNPEHSVIGWPSESIYRQRQVELSKKLFELMNIKREDNDKRSQ